ncbi:MAG: hypothetical protein V7711_12460, partial [Pseudomonadales bacterium]
SFEKRQRELAKKKKKEEKKEEKRLRKAGLLESPAEDAQAIPEDADEGQEATSDAPVGDGEETS